MFNTPKDTMLFISTEAAYPALGVPGHCTTAGIHQEDSGDSSLLKMMNLI